MSYGEAGRPDERAPVEASAPERAAPFRIAVAALEAALKESAGLGGVRFLQNRKRVIDLRRKIMTCVAEVSIAGEQAFAGTARSAAFRNAFARMRTAMALHYASWPVVAIELNDPDYRASIQAMRVEYRAFIRWSQILV